VFAQRPYCRRLCAQRVVKRVHSCRAQSCAQGKTVYRVWSAAQLLRSARYELRRQTVNGRFVRLLNLACFVLIRRSVCRNASGDGKASSPQLVVRTLLGSLSSRTLYWASKQASCGLCVSVFALEIRFRTNWTDANHQLRTASLFPVIPANSNIVPDSGFAKRRFCSERRFWEPTEAVVQRISASPACLRSSEDAGLNSSVWASSKGTC